MDLLKKRTHAIVSVILFVWLMSTDDLQSRHVLLPWLPSAADSEKEKKNMDKTEIFSKDGHQTLENASPVCCFF